MGLPWRRPELRCSPGVRPVPTLCNPMNRSTPGLPVHHQLPEFTQTHVHRVSDAVQPSYPLSSPSPPAPHPCSHCSLLCLSHSNLYLRVLGWDCTPISLPCLEWSCLALTCSLLFLHHSPRHDEDPREPLVRRQGSQVSMRVARG